MITVTQSSQSQRCTIDRTLEVMFNVLHRTATSVATAMRRQQSCLEAEIHTFTKSTCRQHQLSGVEHFSPERSPGHFRPLLTVKLSNLPLTLTLNSYLNSYFYVKIVAAKGDDRETSRGGGGECADPQQSNRCATCMYYIRSRRHSICSQRLMPLSPSTITITGIPRLLYNSFEQNAIINACGK